MTQNEISDNGCRLEKGLVNIFTGHGKGKTSAAIGTSIRAAGHGLRVYMLFMMKANEHFDHGEFKILKSLPHVTVDTFGFRGWARKGNITPEHRAEASAHLDAAFKAMTSGDYDVIVLDEINAAVGGGLIDIEKMVNMIEQKPECVELILTGRNADPRLVQMADLVSEILMIKHPLNEGIRARKGIDY
ncbi:cob(I)yrinic acid a,c-diamide adenosyltransferase [Dehalogenimonas sp. THU2]|uniref:cob(I)yrinic acid a,c-diamide adenosyltransferase n=1 Tax=Dehalogenimonas sp. THU2 TaxID=3151121 RepID=UPI003218BE36